MSDPYIRARNLTKIYKSGGADLVIFDDLNLDVAKGEMLALVGESGAGKSTLLHLLGGLDWPLRGRISTETVAASVTGFSTPFVHSEWSNSGSRPP